jgi:RNA recognition motif-containing protein
MLGAGIIEDVRVQREKGFGFVRYRSHEEAAYAIQAANGRIIGGKSVKVCHISCEAKNIMLKLAKLAD